MFLTIKPYLIPILLQQCFSMMGIIELGHVCWLLGSAECASSMDFPILEVKSFRVSRQGSLRLWNGATMTVLSPLPRPQAASDGKSKVGASDMELPLHNRWYQR